MDTNELKQTIISDIEARSKELSELCLKIHANPELGMHEEKAAAWLTKYLETNGFKVERGICDMPTAFRAVYGKDRPAVAFLAEYDALPEVGHACGHNIIATSAVGAGVAAKIVADNFPGTIQVIGTPAEELIGGKIEMANKAAFNDLDAAMLVHPGMRDTATSNALACITLDVEFFGKSAHAAAEPELGRNALEAMILAFNAIDALRQHIKPVSRIHGIITNGGSAANVVPEHSAGSFLVRAEEDTYLDELKQRVLDCFIGAAMATGTRLEHRWSHHYAPMRNNNALANIFLENMTALGRNVRPEGDKAIGSTDMGNVSQVVPAIHPFVAIAPLNTASHSPEFAAAAASEIGIKGMLDAAKTMAMTAADLLSNPKLMDQIKVEFK
ncbi:MAG: M20 family metallopeptidase [Dehalococcoidales bacterium]|nr:M20 family metallopeptidase [Dehalococcoidales bacterium]